MNSAEITTETNSSSSPKQSCFVLEVSPQERLTLNGLLSARRNSLVGSLDNCQNIDDKEERRTTYKAFKRDLKEVESLQERLNTINNLPPEVNE